MMKDNARVNAQGRCWEGGFSCVTLGAAFESPGDPLSLVCPYDVCNVMQMSQVHEDV